MVPQIDERDLILSQMEFAYIRNTTSGVVVICMGPMKSSMSETDKPCIYDKPTGKFKNVPLEQSIQTLRIAPDGSYIKLTNPTEDVGNFPEVGKGKLDPIPLNIGKKINIPGPISIALWPSQTAEILQGHHLRSNQYLLCRVYDEEEAKKNWKNAVVKSQSGDDEETKSKSKSKTEIKSADIIKIEDLSIGRLFIVQGTEISFFIPPTGIEVLVGVNEKYIQDAVTLERLEYSILRDESGEKRYVRGPDVVFPKPTEQFLEEDSKRKFKAIELNQISGIYVKVIDSYKDERNEYKEGDELFITGRETQIYIPRPEHAIIKYGNKTIIYSVAIPSGEGRYIMDRMSGKIEIKQGPSMLLPDPRTEVIIRRVLDHDTVKLWYPENKEALNYNQKLSSMLQKETNYITDSDFQTRGFSSPIETEYNRVSFASTVADLESPGKATFGDDIKRSSTYSAPRSVVLNTKYDGVPIIEIWTGYAIQVVSRTNKRKVIVGPQAYLMGYDEKLEVMSLSTGRPKTTDNLIQTVYLRVQNNYITDQINIETSDFCKLNIKLSYKVNFTGDKDKWFNVDNYIKYLCDHLRSLVKCIIKKLSINEFYSNSAEIIRDLILGESKDKKERSGLTMAENGVHIYECEVLKVEIESATVKDLLEKTQNQIINNTIAVTCKQNNLITIEKLEDLERKILDIKGETDKKQHSLILESIKRNESKQLKELARNTEVSKQSIIDSKILRELEKEVTVIVSSIDKIKWSNNNEQAKASIDNMLHELSGKIKAEAERLKAITPELSATLKLISQQMTLTNITKDMVPLSIIKGTSIVGALGQLFNGTPLESIVKNLKNDGLSIKQDVINK